MKTINERRTIYNYIEKYNSWFVSFKNFFSDKSVIKRKTHKSVKKVRSQSGTLFS